MYILIMQNFCEQQKPLQQNYCMYELENMGETNDRKSPLPPPSKYVSIFCLDGEPILPPLMTTEKRHQMQKLKEKALRIEIGIRERKQEVCAQYYNRNVDTKRGNSCPRLPQTTGEVKETEKSIVLLKNSVQGAKEKIQAKCTKILDNTFYQERKQEKLKRLRKSELIIYDNPTHRVIQIPVTVQKKMIDDQGECLRDGVCQPNYTYLLNKNPIHMLSGEINSKHKTDISSICVKPPTPLLVTKSFLETLTGNESKESFINSEKLNQSIESDLDLSSDDSLITMPTQSDKKSKTIRRQHNAKPVIKCPSTKTINGTSLTPIKNLCVKTPQFETVSSESHTPQSSPEKHCNDRSKSSETSNGLINCTASIFPIKATVRNRSPSCGSQDSDNWAANTLVRSSSFTLDRPSKVLIEHMQHQNVTNDSNAVVYSPLDTTRNLSNKILSSPLNSYTDAVQCKAKKVVKKKQSPMTSQKKIKPRLAKSLSSTSSNTCGTPKTAKESLHRMDKEKSEQFLQLLNQQEEENQRLQQSFKLQQTLLTQQLNQEMVAPLSTTKDQKNIGQQQIFRNPGTQNPSVTVLNLPPSNKTQSQSYQSSSCRSNNSSYINFDNQSQILNSHQLPSFASGCSDSCHSISAKKLDLSSMEHSNTNSPLNISTLSTETPSIAICTTPSAQNFRASNYKARRRLFTTKIDGTIDVNGKVSSCAPSNDWSAKQGQHLHKFDRSDDINERSQIQNTLTVHGAATKINAYARGFLVRRLFQTEQVQRIVQTIRDTLIFVLSLHIETIENPEESQTTANIKLKARLLQQLSSACRTLHLVFFQTSIKERMEIIARDRKRINNKLMSSNFKRLRNYTEDNNFHP